MTKAGNALVLGILDRILACCQASVSHPPIEIGIPRKMDIRRRLRWLIRKSSVASINLATGRLPGAYWQEVPR